jgi:methionine-rich copper-binding protein CopC
MSIEEGGSIMFNLKPKVLLVALILASYSMLAGCSEDEAETPKSDTTPPTVIGHFPSDGATDITRSGPFWILFSESMNEESVIDNLDFNPDPGYSSCFSGDTVFITPTSLLDSNTPYTITAGEESEDLSGNRLENDYTFTFTTTTEGDLTSPYVVSTSPESDEIDVSSTQPIEITFSEPMNHTATEYAFDIEPEPMDMEAEWETVKMIVYHSPLPEDSSISVSISTTAEDLAGNNLEEEYTFTFRTIEDKIHPYLVSASPANGASGVSAGLPQMVFNFSEPMYTNFDMLAEMVDVRINQIIDHDNIDWNEDYSSLTVPIRTGENLLAGCTYWVDFFGVTDAAGNVIYPNPTHYEFTTSGTLSYFPVQSGYLWYYETNYGTSATRNIENYNHSAGTFEVVLREEMLIHDIWHMKATSAQIQHLGIDSYDDIGNYEFTLTWDDPLPFLKLPVPSYADSTWDFSTTSSLGSYNVTITGHVEIEKLPVNMVREDLYGTFKGCYVHHLYANMAFYDGETQVNENSIHNTSWLSPGVGAVKVINEEDGEEPDTLMITNWDF